QAVDLELLELAAGAGGSLGLEAGVAGAEEELVALLYLGRHGSAIGQQTRCELARRSEPLLGLGLALIGPDLDVEGAARRSCSGRHHRLEGSPFGDRRLRGSEARLQRSRRGCDRR